MFALIRRFGRNFLSQLASRTSPIKQSQQRHFRLNIFEAAKNATRLQQLRVKLNDKNQDSKTVLEYLRALNANHPNEVMESIERGWLNGKLPFDEMFLKEYIKAVSAVRKVDALNVSGLLKLLATHNGGPLTPIAAEQVIRPLATAPLYSAGSSPAEPLYIAQQDSTFRSQMWKTVRSAVGLFLTLTLIGAFFEDKLSGGGGISGRISGSSAVHQAEKPDKTFEDVEGIDEAKAELQEIVMYLRDPKKFTRLGGRLPKGVLLTGPPGTGKTLLARAIAGEAKVPFFHASGSEFEEMYVGVGAKRVRELFEIAKKKSPCIIFIDEIDAIGGSRHLKDQSAMKMTLNQLLVEMDGFAQNNGIIVIAATNFADSLDSALIRPGRFDKHVDVSVPDIGGRKAILELYAKKVPMDKDVDMDQLARGTPGFSGAELFNLINQAALKASVEGLKAVNMFALEYAKDKLMMGAERKSAIISPETMKMTAFHEAGHALVALKTPGADPVHKATIMPRGRALGMVMQLPEGDQTSMTRQQMLARLDVCMGGRVAEELVFGKQNVTSGASSDIMQATRLARAMVTQYGLSDKVGIVFFDEKKNYSSVSQNEIDNEVKDLLSASYERAKGVLLKYRLELDLIAKALMEYESISGQDIVEVMDGKAIEAAKRSQKPSRPIQSIAVLQSREGEKEPQNISPNAVANVQDEREKQEKESVLNSKTSKLAAVASAPGPSPATIAAASSSSVPNTTPPPSPAHVSAPESKPSASRGPPKI